jgi:sporulation protein YlmC with PRC-barrel domain
MKRMTTFLVVLSIVSLLLTTPSFAQQLQPLSDTKPNAAMTPSGVEKSVEQQVGQPAVLKASTFIGISVMNNQDESLGKIEDLVIDPMTGLIKYAALSYGSILGLGGKLFAISWDSLEMLPGGETFILNISRETLENLPGFDKDNWPRRPDPVLRATARKAMREGM